MSQHHDLPGPVGGEVLDSAEGNKPATKLQGSEPLVARMRMQPQDMSQNPRGILPGMHMSLVSLSSALFRCHIQHTL
eukprot:365650-Chlamydomonas_euryale.AAC.14